MAILSPTSTQLAPLIDPVAQKLADLEARLARLESALTVVGGDVTLKSTGAIAIEAGKGTSMKAGTMVTLDAGGGVTVKAMLTTSIQAGGTMTIKGAMVNIN
jgi:hypothetical protein